MQLPLPRLHRVAADDPAAWLAEALAPPTGGPARIGGWRWEGEGRVRGLSIDVGDAARRLVVKRVAGDSHEARLALAGVPGRLPAEVRWPIVALAEEPTLGELWLLMRDVRGGMRSHAGFRFRETKALMPTLARMHARFLGATSDLGRGLPEGAAVDEGFAAALEAADEALYRELCASAADLAGRLGELTPTLCHGALSHRHIAFDSGGVALLGWGRACAAPPQWDLAQHLFAEVWADPQPHRALAGERVVHIYLAHLEATLDRRLDRARFARGLELAWALALAHHAPALDPQSARTRLAFERARRARL